MNRFTVRGPQKICFFDWLVNEINSGKHEGLYWLDENHTLFRIPWKHNSRKDLVPSDYMIFKEWAIFSGKHVETVRDPARWKTNFRCALNSTRRFEEVKSNGPDYHVYRIIAAQPNNAPAANLPANTSKDNRGYFTVFRAIFQYLGRVQYRCSTSPCDIITLTSVSASSEVPTSICLKLHRGHLEVRDEALDGIMKMKLAPVLTKGALLNETPYEQNGAYVVPEMDQPLKNQRANEPVRNNCYEEPLSWLVQNAVNSQSPATVPLQQAQQTPLDINKCNHVGCISFLAGAFPLQLDVSIHYRGRPMCELVVEESSCVFTYEQCYADVPPNTQIIRFPETEELPDKKQAKSTLEVLHDTGLLLYQKNEKLCARRLGKSRLRHLCSCTRGFGQMAYTMCPDFFLTELRTFMNGQIHSFPDYTIYLCFGQRLSASKPKESKLILVKLVSRVCKYFHEQSQREGASSLNIENDSLQISNSLYDMVEQLSTMFYAANGAKKIEVENSSTRPGPSQQAVRTLALLHGVILGIFSSRLQAAHDAVRKLLIRQYLWHRVRPALAYRMPSRRFQLLAVLANIARGQECESSEGQESRSAMEENM
ncbi:hypothetical protein JRQ81_000268 [Phrynocephalus forsythii]|uniref:IRF tryptophan pentad repeat domain-containing protein n=1 Tax=Phrynocephalus forsythii TaxID=171643 RepID=A0A9Q0Y5T5_9SAUR|nr:hypothetical protein JRQ81_000268 [Phrynocephalus forsythii]